MKKLLVMMTMLLLSACGSGGGGVANTPTDVTSGTATGVLVVKFATPSDDSRSFAATPGKHVRVVISNPSLRYDGQFFKAIQDADPGSDISFSLPLATGYTVEAITYVTDATTGLNTVAKYAVASGVKVTDTTSAPITLNLVDIAATVGLPAEGIVQGTRYYVMANFSTAAGRRATPLHSAWYLPKPQITPFTGFTNNTSATVFSTTHYFTAPLVGVSGTNLYFQGVFTLRPNLLASGETLKQWVFNSPRATDAPFSAPVLAPTNVVITVPDVP